MHDIRAINYSTFEDYRVKIETNNVSQMAQSKQNFEYDLQRDVYSSGWILKNVSFMRREK